MNETFFIRLINNGQQIRLNSASREGVLLENEVDAWPRSFMMEFDGDTPVTKYRMDRVRQLNGWGIWDYRLQLFRATDGTIGVTGVTPTGLPPGSYWFRLKISDLEISRKKFKVRLQEDEKKIVDVEAAPDPRQIQLKPIVDLDINQVLVDQDSRIDGVDLVTWVNDPANRANRRACLLNLLAKLRTSPSENDPLLADVESIFFADVDRIYAGVGSRFLTRLIELNGTNQFYYEGEPSAPVHRKILDRLTWEPDAQSFHLLSYRQEGHPSLQCVIAVPPAPIRTHYVDLDLDLGNPLQDVLGFFIHLGELIGPGKTDHLKLRSELKVPTKNYLYYDLV